MGPSNPEATDAAIKDGWLYTGDYGRHVIEKHLNVGLGGINNTFFGIP